MISGPVSLKCSVRVPLPRRTQFLFQDHPLKQVFLLSSFRSTTSVGGVVENIYHLVVQLYSTYSTPF
jgi:hypothetical protein